MHEKSEPTAKLGTCRTYNRGAVSERATKRMSGKRISPLSIDLRSADAGGRFCCVGAKRYLIVACL